jgi:hypothetical protein
MPGVEERARIWQLQIHPRKTPLTPEVDFQKLAERYAMTGGDIKNAVIKAAAMAASEPGPDLGKRIDQRHFEFAAEEVLAAKSVMRQSLFSENPAAPSPVQVQAIESQWRKALILALALAGVAFVTALGAVALALLRLSTLTAHSRIYSAYKRLGLSLRILRANAALILPPSASV